MNLILSSSDKPFRHTAILLIKEVSSVDVFTLIRESATLNLSFLLLESAAGALFLLSLLESCVQLGSVSAILGSQSVVQGRLRKLSADYGILQLLASSQHPLGMLRSQGPPAPVF